MIVSSRVSLLATELFDTRIILKTKIKSLLKRPRSIKSNGPDEVLKSLTKCQGIKRIRSLRSLSLLESENLLILRDFLDKIPVETARKIASNRILLGPNIDFMLERNLRMLDFFPQAHLVVPSEWVISVLKSEPYLKNRKFVIWAAGVDLNFWSGKDSSEIKTGEVLVYLKSEIEVNTLKQVKQTLENLGYSYQVVQYGFYGNYFFREILKRSDFAIWLGSTESQGIAQFQSWAMGVPTLVQRKDTYFAGKETFLSSSSPYLSPQTGCFTKTDDVTPDDINEFVSTLSLRSPRAWIESNATIEIAGEKLKQCFLEVDLGIHPKRSQK